MCVHLSTQSFRSLPQKPMSVDLTVEEGQRLKVIYGSLSGFHAIDVDSGTPYDLYLPTHVRVYVIFFLLHTFDRVSRLSEKIGYFKKKSEVECYVLLLLEPVIKFKTANVLGKCSQKDLRSKVSKMLLILKRSFSKNRCWKRGFILSSGPCNIFGHYTFNSIQFIYSIKS